MFEGKYVDDSNGEAIASGTVVTLTIHNENNGETKVIHLSSESWDQVLEESETLSSAVFSD